MDRAAALTVILASPTVVFCKLRDSRVRFRARLSRRTIPVQREIWGWLGIWRCFTARDRSPVERKIVYFVKGGNVCRNAVAHPPLLSSALHRSVVFRNSKFQVEIELPFPLFPPPFRSPL